MSLSIGTEFVISCAKKPPQKITTKTKNFTGGSSLPVESERREIVCQHRKEKTTTQKTAQGSFPCYTVRVNTKCEVTETQTTGSQVILKNVVTVLFCCTQWAMFYYHSTCF